ncbi:MAG: hypothetical protein V1702_01555 [Candidatus Woesearchaeota archaeon]
MAKAIMPTPILKGEDKKLFIQSLKVSYSADKEKFLNECKTIIRKIKLDV